MDLPLSLLVRCHLFKMVCFARLSYPLKTMPILMKQNYNYLLKSEMVYPYSLKALLHAKWKSVLPDLQHNLLLQDTVIAWREIRKKLNLSPYISRHLPIHGNPMFPSGMEHKAFSLWQEQGLTKFSSLYDLSTGTPYAFSEIAEKFFLPTAHALYYGQCVSFVHSHCRNSDKRFQPSIPNRLLEMGTYSISDI